MAGFYSDVLETIECPNAPQLRFTQEDGGCIDKRGSPEGDRSGKVSVARRRGCEGGPYPGMEKIRGGSNHAYRGRLRKRHRLPIHWRGYFVNSIIT